MNDLATVMLDERAVLDEQSPEMSTKSPLFTSKIYHKKLENSANMKF